MAYLKKYSFFIAGLTCLTFYFSIFPPFGGIMEGFSQQSFEVLYLEDFSSGASSVPPFGFKLNTGGTGNNQWYINDVYSGQGTYPDVPSQDSTLGSIGQISDPDSNYLHIKNISSSVLNANYNPASVSERWAYMDTGYCTMGYLRVVFQFWWLCKGSPADYGEVYYSVNGGSVWNLCTNTDGFSKYGNQPIWKFSSVDTNDFLNRTDLRFAFRWVNDGVNTNDVLPFSVDDIMMVAYYDPANPISISISQTTPLQVCHEDLNNPISMTFNVKGATCPGYYLISISDSDGNFINSTPIGIFSLNGTNPGNNIFNISLGAANIRIPTSIPFGDCYLFRIDRITPPEAIGTSSTVCIEVIDCVDSIRTQQPKVTMDPYYAAGDTCNMTGLPTGQQPLCIYSVLDVPFLSYGAYNPGNNYILELSDSSGSFTNGQTIGGPMPDTRTWDPALGYLPPPPGSISGQIPEVPPGCNYYIRVTATNPLVNNTPYGLEYSAPWGPFCIKDCDVKTNDSTITTQGAQDISVCITLYDSTCVDLYLNINMFDSSIFYDTVNSFKVQLLAPPDIMHTTPMAIVDEGSLVLYRDTLLQDTIMQYDSSAHFILCIPPIPDYIGIAGHLGMHYMRIVSGNSSDSCNEKGSLIRLTVSGISGDGPLLAINPQEIHCGDQYQNSVTFTILNPAPPSVGSIYILYITGFVPIEWDVAQWGTSVSLSFPPVSGTYYATIREQSKDGKCVSPFSDTLKIIIDLMPDVNINGPDKLCAGDTATFSANFENATFYQWNVNWSNPNVGELLYYGNNEITLKLDNIGSAEIELMAQNECAQNSKTITVNVFPNAVAKAGPDTIVCFGDSITIWGKNALLPVQNEFTWFLNTYADTIRDTSIIVGGDSFMRTIYQNSVYMVKVDNGCPDYDTVYISVIQKPVIYASDAKVCIGDSVQFSTPLPDAVSYLWLPNSWMDDNTSETPVVFPPVNTTYTVTVVYDTRCEPLTDDAYLKVNDLPVADAGNDVEIFEGIGTNLNATGGVGYSWSPPYGLDNTFSQSPFANPDSNTTYFVTVTDANGCISTDSVKVTVIPAVFKPGIPGGFTPNGDGVNDKFMIYDIVGKEGMAVTFFEFKIFDRWGELIFETDNVKEGWDGTNQKTGKKMEVGVYIWLLTAESVKGEKIGPVSGNVTLLR